MATMKAIILDAHGGVENLRDGELPRPEPQADQVRIRVQAVSLNPVDCKMRQGRIPADLPAVLGRDAAGVVDAVGPGVERFREGDPVVAVLFGPRSNGAYAQYVCSHVAFVHRTPWGLSPQQAATLGVAGLTAYEVVMRKARVQAGEPVLVAGGSGGVGSYAVPLLRMLGAEPVLATAGGEESAAYLAGRFTLHPEWILRYPGLSLEAMAEWVHERTGGDGVAAALDLVGGDMKRLCFRVIGFYGRVVSCVEESAPDFDIPLWHPADSPLFRRSGSFHYVGASAAARFGEPRHWGAYQEMFAALTELVDTGMLPIAQVTDLGELSGETIRAAHRRLEAGHVKGKLALTVP